MARIQVLDKHVAELIAAGEVVERPSSVVKELFENAIDAGATSVTVEIRNGGVTYMSISDNGCGIPQEDIPNMFQRFSQGTSKKRSAGTGLGLYLSRQIVESHGGKIWLESTLNKGSEFSFILTDVVQNETEECNVGV